MVVIETKVKKWGNSFGVVIPKEIIESSHIREDENIGLIVFKKNPQALKKTFGIGKGRIKKSGQEFKDDARREIY